MAGRETARARHDTHTAQSYQHWLDSRAADIFSDDEYVRAVKKDRGDRYHINPSNHEADGYFAQRHRESDLVQHGVHFIHVPWHDITDMLLPFGRKTSARKLQYTKLRKLAELWRCLDWLRYHYVILMQASIDTIEADVAAATAGHLSLGGSTPFSFSHPRLLVFDSRLSALQYASCGLAPRPNVVAIPLWHWPSVLSNRSRMSSGILGRTAEQRFAEWSRATGYAQLSACGAKRMVDQEHGGGSSGSAVLSSQARRPTHLSFRGNCDDASRPHRAKLLDRLRRHLKTRTNESKHATYDLSCRKALPEAYFAVLCSSQWYLAVSGTFPPSFMMYEAIFAGARPLFVFTARSQIPEQNATNCGGHQLQDSLDAYLPFHDEGVRWSELGATISDWTDIHRLGTVVRERVLGNWTAAGDLGTWRAPLPLSLRHSFSPEGTFDYVLRRVHRWLQEQRSARAASNSERDVQDETASSVCPPRSICPLHGKSQWLGGHDGFGAQLLRMLTLLGEALHTSSTFCGRRWRSMQHNVNAYAMYDFVGGALYGPPASGSTVQIRSAALKYALDFRTRGLARRHYDATAKPPLHWYTEKRLNVALHVRRGDAMLAKYRNTTRWTGDKYYVNCIRHMAQSLDGYSGAPAAFHIFSDGTRSQLESLASDAMAFLKTDQSLHVHTARGHESRADTTRHTQMVFHHLVSADLLVAGGGSAFGRAAALLSRNRWSLFPDQYPPWHSPSGRDSLACSNATSAHILRSFCSRRMCHNISL